MKKELIFLLKSEIKENVIEKNGNDNKKEAKKQFNSFSESENKIKAKKESSNIEIIKKKEKDF